MNEFDYSDITFNEEVVFKDILLHSPYESLLDCGLKEAAFWKHLLVINKEYENTAQKIFTYLHQGEESRTFLFLKGFSGCGKTTFIRWFIKEVSSTNSSEKESEIYNQYINLSFNTTYNNEIDDKDDKTNTDSDESKAKKETYLNQTIIQIIKDNFPQYKSTFKFIYDNLNKLISKLGGLSDKDEALATVINENCENLTFNRELSNLIDNLPTRTLMTICFLQKIIYTRERGQRMCFFCIDNLDSLNYAYLTKGFWEDFLYSYNKLAEIVKIAGWNFDIKKRLKFLFVLREHHYHLIKVNLNTHRYAVITASVATFTLTQPDLGTILKKRVDLAESMKIDVNGRIIKMVKLILTEDEIYREKFYLPLFNYDLRKLNQKIVQIVLEGEQIQFEFNFDKYQELYDYRVFNKITRRYEYPYRNGARGVLIHCFLKTLFQSDEKYPVEPIFDDPPEYYSNHPYCSYCRLLLTLIYNLTCSSSNRLNRNLDNLNTITTSDFTLDDLIRQLRIYPKQQTEPLIPIDNVFSWLKHFYTIGNSTVTHLINISGKASKANKKFSFDAEIDIATNVKNADLAQSDLNDIHIRINPSGVVYLRYLIPHFEFFASYKYWRKDRFDKEFKPLYISTDIIEDIHQSKTIRRYEFEILLEDVFNLVQRKKKQNDRFLEEKIFEDSKLPRLANYLNSNFVVHFRETADSLYSTRLISTHLTYIDQFRRFITEDSDFVAQVDINKNKYGTKSVDEIKNFILNIQKKYVELYFETQGDEVFDNTLVEVMRMWRIHINNLIKGKGSSWHSLDYERSLYDE